ncbi:MAG: RNA polymerase sigma factor [Planctomycetota bacterium]
MSSFPLPDLSDAPRLGPPFASRPMSAVGQSRPLVSVQALREDLATGCDQDACDAVVERHQQALWRYLRHLGCDRESAADLAQDAFVVLLRRGPGVAPGAEFSFLRSTARNLFLNWRRTQVRGVQLPEWVEAVDETWQQLRQPDARLERLRECTAALGQRAREGVRCFYEWGLSREETAARMKISAHGVKSLLQRARAALARCMERCPQNPQTNNGEKS